MTPKNKKPIVKKDESLSQKQELIKRNADTIFEIRSELLRDTKEYIVDIINYGKNGTIKL